MKGKKILIISVLVLLGLFVVGISNFLFAPHPTEQPGTTWSTKDGRITFSIPDKTAPFGVTLHGTIKSDKGIIDVEFVMSNLAGCVAVYLPEDHKLIQNGEFAKPIEFWTEVSVQTDRFIVKVKNTTYFEENQELVFIKNN